MQPHPLPAENEEPRREQEEQEKRNGQRAGVGGLLELAEGGSEVRFRLLSQADGGQQGPTFLAGLRVR